MRVLNLTLDRSLFDINNLQFTHSGRLTAAHRQQFACGSKGEGRDAIVEG